MPNVLSPRDLVSRPDNMDETVLHRFALASITTDPEVLLLNSYKHKSKIELKFIQVHSFCPTQCLITFAGMIIRMFIKMIFSLYNMPFFTHAYSYCSIRDLSDIIGLDF